MANTAAKIHPPTPGHPSGHAVVRSGWGEGWRRPPPQLLSVWADHHRILPRKSSAEPGRWRTDRTPYLREIMDALSPEDPCQEVVLMAGTQVGKTEAGNNWVGYVVDHCPGPMMVVQPTLDLAKRWSKQRLSAMIDEMPVLRTHIKPARSRDSGNTTLTKEFPGGILVISGANSAASLRSMPVKYIFFDEIDAYPDDVDGEGDPLDLGEARTSNFPRRKIFKTSTPTVKGASNIEAAYDRSDQRQYQVPCPHCDAHQVLDFDNLIDDGKYLCAHCGELIEEHAKTWMLAHGQWVARHLERKVRGYHLNSLYSPLGLGYTWQELAEQRHAAQDNKAKEKTFTNLRRGEAYEDPDGRLDAADIATLAGDHAMRDIPPGCLLVTAGVDVQANRFAVQLLGWGWDVDAKHLRVWTIDWLELAADPTDETTWAELDEYLDQPLTNAWGIQMPISMTAIDSGNWTHEVYAYVRNSLRKVIAVKGMSTGGRPVIGRPSWQDISFRGRTIKRGVQMWPVGTDTAKNTLLGRIAKDIGRESSEHRHIMPSDLPDDYYTQLTAERSDPERSRWIKLKGRRNEAIDTMVYAYAAACHPKIRLGQLREPDWLRLHEQYEPRIEDLFGEAAPADNVPRGTGTPPAVPVIAQLPALAAKTNAPPPKPITSADPYLS